MSLRAVLLAGVVALGIGVALAYALWLRPLRHAADLGAGLLAKQICSCVFIAERSSDDCRADQLTSLDPIPFEILRDPPRVRASIPFIADRVAVYREGFGCSLP